MTKDADMVAFEAQIREQIAKEIEATKPYGVAQQSMIDMLFPFPVGPEELSKVQIAWMVLIERYKSEIITIARGQK